MRKIMKTNIKFRVWCNITKHFTDIPFYSCGGGQLLWHQTGNEITISNIDEGDYEVQRFTGLKDKNGKDIYEGDFITFSCNYTIDSSDVDVIQWRNQEVFYNEEYAGFYFGRKREFKILDEIMPDTIEVVGNIFENPDLSIKEK